MIYRLPTTEDEKALMEYVKEHQENEEWGISASMGLASTPYDEWLNMIHTNASEGNAEWGRSLCLVCCEKGQIIGLLSIRYELPAELTDKIGDVGYGVRPSERNKGYATEMLRYALTVCKEHGMKRIVLGCYKDNMASSSVIRKCNGILIEENENYEPGRISQYFAIEI